MKSYERPGRTDYVRRSGRKNRTRSAPFCRVSRPGVGRDRHVYRGCFDERSFHRAAQFDPLSLIPWKERGWHFGLSEPMCHKVGVDTGDPVHVEMCRPKDARPDELKELLKDIPEARKAWDGLSAGEQRDFVFFVAYAAKTETRARRARRILGR